MVKVFYILATIGVLIALGYLVMRRSGLIEGSGVL